MNTPETQSLLSSVGYLGRDIKNNTAHARHALNDLASNSTEAKEFAERTLPLNLANVVRDAEAIAAKLPALRALSSGEVKSSKVESLGSSIVVRYKPQTNSRGAGWIATLWRDTSTTFRASSSFTYEDSDNDGADIAATKCLAKFTAYCNSDDLGLPKVTHRLTARVSLGNGSYAYTFTR
jgi:hypothetical protein